MYLNLKNLHKLSKIPKIIYLTSQLCNEKYYNK